MTAANMKAANIKATKRLMLAGAFHQALVMAAGISLLALPFFAALTAAPALAQDTGRRSPSYRPPVEVDSPEPGIESQYQLQLLQQEVAELRGQLEELRFQVEQLNALQADRYLEMDSRLQQLMRSAPLAEPTASGWTAPELTAPAPPPASNDGAAAGTEAMDEAGLYASSQQLISRKKYDQAIDQFKAQVARFPEGELAANAYYWMGELYMVLPEPDLEAAWRSLARVIAHFPQHRKVPDALLKLGMVHYRRGDCQRAEELLSQVVAQYEGKAVAKLAQNYLQDTVQCGN